MMKNLEKWPKISKLIGWDFSTNGNLDILNEWDQTIYREDKWGTRTIWYWDSNGKNYLLRDSNGFWIRSFYSADGDMVYSINSHGMEEKLAPEEIISQILRDHKLEELLGNIRDNTDQTLSNQK